MRPLLAGVACAQTVLALLFAFQVPLATELWPFGSTSSMTYLFLASILLAAAASVGWCLVERSQRGFSGMALDYLTLMIPLAVLAFLVAVEDADPSAARLGLVSLGAAAFGAYLLRWSLRRPWQGALPTPRLVVGAFGLFVAALEDHAETLADGRGDA